MLESCGVLYSLTEGVIILRPGGFMLQFTADFGADFMSKSRLRGSDTKYQRVN